LNGKQKLKKAIPFDVSKTMRKNKILRQNGKKFCARDFTSPDQNSGVFSDLVY
jgi:hypothetical protein